MHYKVVPFDQTKNINQELQNICTANIKDEVGKCTYTHMLNEGAGIETDLTVV